MRKSAVTIDTEPLLREFRPDPGSYDHIDGLSTTDDGWRLVAKQGGSVRLGLVSELELSGCRVIYRADVRSRDLGRPAYLEARYRTADGNSFSSQGRHNPLKGNNSWKTIETHFDLRSQETATDVSVRLTTEDSGIVEIRNVRLLSYARPPQSTSRHVLVSTLLGLGLALRYIALTVINIILVCIQFGLSIYGESTGPWEFITWWPKRRSPKISQIRRRKQRGAPMAVLTWLKSRIGSPRPTGPAELFRRFSPDTDVTITRDGVTEIDCGWRVESADSRAFKLFEIAEPGIEQCMVTYRAEMRSTGVTKRAYLEMWCRIPGRGEFFSRGVRNPLKGDTGWASHEIPFYLRAGQQPDLIKLNVVLDGPGTVELRSIEVLVTPLS